MIHKFFYYLSEKAEDISQSLGEPATPQEIADFEQKHQVQLPEVFKQFYLKHNGQRPEWEYTFIDNQRLLSLSEIDEIISFWKGELAEMYGENWQSIRKEDFIFEEAIKNTLYHGKWIPFLISDSVYTCVDLAPEKSGQTGQVISVMPSMDLEYYDIFLEEFSFEEWLNSLSEGLEEETIVYDDEMMSLTDLTLYDDENYAPEPDEISEGGSPVYRYEEDDDESFHAPEREAVYLDEIVAHIEKHIGDPESVFHEIISEYAHIDVHWVRPNEKYPYNFLITSGMSDMPMHLPKELENPEQYRYAEMMVILPADWEISETAFEDDANYWPIHFLKTLARLPHQYKTWLGYGHTLPNGENAAPIANTDFGCMLVMPPFITLDEDFLQMQTSDGNIINFYAMIPLYKEEMELKLNEGLEALMDKFDDYEIDEVVDINRPNTAL